MHVVSPVQRQSSGGEPTIKQETHRESKDISGLAAEMMGCRTVSEASDKELNLP
jgi:hypothetical protein